MSLHPRQPLIALVAVLCATGIVRADDPPPAVVAYLGVTTKSADHAAAAANGLPDGVGLAVTFVDAKGPLAAADVRPGDVLQKLDDQLLVNAPQLVTLIRLHRAADAVTLTRLRDGKSATVTVTLGQKRRPADPATPPAGGTGGPTADPIPTLPGVGNVDPVTGVLPFDAQLPLPANGAKVAVSFDDGTYTAKVETDAAGRRRMTVTDAAGRRVAAGPVDTEPQWQAFPADVRSHLQAMRDVITGHARSTSRPSK